MAPLLQPGPGEGAHLFIPPLLLHGVQPSPESHGELGQGGPKWGLLISVSPISLHWLDFKKEEPSMRCLRRFPFQSCPAVRSSELPDGLRAVDETRKACLQLLPHAVTQVVAFLETTQMDSLQDCLGTLSRWAW